MCHIAVVVEGAKAIEASLQLLLTQISLEQPGNTQDRVCAHSLCTITTLGVRTKNKESPEFAVQNSMKWCCWVPRKSQSSKILPHVRTLHRPLKMYWRYIPMHTKNYWGTRKWISAMFTWSRTAQIIPLNTICWLWSRDVLALFRTFRGYIKIRGSYKPTKTWNTLCDIWIQMWEVWISFHSM